MIWAIGYGLGFIVTTGLVYRRMLWNERDLSYVDSVDCAMFLLGAAGIGAVWPLVAVGAPFIAWVKRDLEKNHPEEIAARQRDRELEILKRENEIKRIEIELGIREPEKKSEFPLSRGLFPAWGIRR